MVKQDGGDPVARCEAQPIVKDIPSGNEQVGGGGHWTRDLEFSPDGETLYVSVGSRSNVDDDERETRRAAILAFDPDGKNERLFASGIRNPVGLATHPKTGQLWTSVNERDLLGDNLVPDYITHVEEGGFYGWPWYYLGGRHDPEHVGKHPELKDKVIVPDVLLQSHIWPFADSGGVRPPCLPSFSGSLRTHAAVLHRPTWDQLSRLVSHA
jgi:glucose/arabinose dehydrogenase